MSALWIAPPSAPAKFDGTTRFQDSPSGPTRLDAVRFLGRIARTPWQFFPGRPILGAIFLELHNVEYAHTEIKCNALRYYVTVHPKSANQKIRHALRK